MSALVEPFAEFSPTQDINVLAAAVDGLHPPRAFGDTPHGFSFYYGPMKGMMPDLWQNDELKSPRDSKQQAAISFHLKTQAKFGTNVKCTLPLANTIFQNGLQSTLLASRWRWSGPDSSPKLAHVTEKQSQNVTCWDPHRDTTIVIESPLLPITAPRKILAGLGNIIRQVEVDGKETPASAELEKAVNELYARRSKEGHGFPPGPVGVWAIVLPPGPMQAADLEYLQEWSENLNQVQTAYEEWGEVMEFKRLVQKLLRHGGRIYKILSGGGGWGKKQGLLSLDPETTYSASSGEEDLDSFISSFMSQHDGSAQQGVVAPGSYIQYAITPAMSARPDVSTSKGATLSIAFGASEPAMSEEPLSTAGSSKWKVVPGHFGAVSSHGLFIKSETNGFVSDSKLDAPGSWLGYLMLGNR
ncbi:uncharacterized protein ColSpa_02324 [Colletotrichum spaethianum]|uniref:V-type c subunit family protein n=1 Tax=Colletotrichum spaethianum TaxID=700344 RepID=A0AA37NZH1_9PEZI|nr:uncharacterized protein ColSpa_02324 [Colletotrichum spaethianum]GKT42143.1 hypothetical protein ColSpa_02324 [Colletotrichum spaethianum]